MKQYTLKFYIGTECKYLCEISAPDWSGAYGQGSQKLEQLKIYERFEIVEL